MVCRVMGVWGWIVLYVLLFALLQFLLYRYLHDEDSTPLHSSPARLDITGLEEGASEEYDAERSDQLRCRHCGATNESGYRFCRNCISQLVG